MIENVDFISNFFSEKNCSTQYRLSIRESSNGFSFCVTNITNGKCMAASHTSELQQNPFSDCDFFEHIYMLDSPFALVPKTLFQSNNSALYLPLEEEQKKKAVIQINEINNQILLVFDESHFPKISIAQNIHPITALLKYAFELETSKKICADFETDKLHLTAVDGDDILLANTYEYESENDAAYYILAVYQELKLDVETFHLYLAGNKNNDKIPLDFLKEYIRNVNMVTPINDCWDKHFPMEDYPAFATQIMAVI